MLFARPVVRGRGRAAASLADLAASDIYFKDGFVVGVVKNVGDRDFYAKDASIADSFKRAVTLKRIVRVGATSLTEHLGTRHVGDARVGQTFNAAFKRPKNVAGACLLSGRERRQGFNGASATGVVVRLEERRGSCGGRSYAPAVRFSTERGQEIEFTATLGTNPPAYGVGDEVPVSYDPERPGSADVDDFASRWLGALALLALGTLFTASAVMGSCPAAVPAAPGALGRGR